MPTDPDAQAKIAAINATIAKLNTRLLSAETSVVSQSTMISDLQDQVDKLKNPPPPPPSGKTVIHVKLGENLQNAINQAATSLGPVDILCQPGKYSVNLVLKRNAQQSPGWITIRPDTADGNITPTSTPWITPQAQGLVQLVSPNNGTTLTTEAGAGRYWLMGLDFPPNAGSTSVDLVVLGTGVETSVDALPFDIVLDRCYLHGDPIKGQHRGLAFHVINGQILSSYFENFFESGRQSQAIATWNSPGPIALRNSFVEAASENFLVGGDDTRIPNLIPSDITVDGNYFFKRPEWKSRTDVKLNVANLIEFKVGRRIRVQNNVFENNWADAQAGAGFVVTVRNQNLGNPWNTIADALIEFNLMKNIAGPVLNTLGTDDQNATVKSVQGTNLIYRHNLAINCNNGVQVNRGFLPTVLRNNTFTKINDWLVQFPTKMPQPNNFILENNVAPLGAYGFTGDGSTSTGKPTLDGMAPGYSVIKNAWQRGNIAVPSGNYDVADLQAMFDSKKRYLGTELGTDGKKVGVDIDALIARIPWATWW